MTRMQPQICLGPHWVIHVILAIAACPVRPKSGLRLWCRPARQAHSEYRALSRLARYRHVAAHHSRELARECKSEPRSAEALRHGGVGLREILKQFRLAQIESWSDIARRSAADASRHRSL